MNQNHENDNGFRRFDGETPKKRSSIGSVIIAAAFLIFWTSMVIAALLNILRTGADIFAILIVLIIGGIGIIGIAKSLIKRIKNLN